MAKKDPAAPIFDAIRAGDIATVEALLRKDKKLANAKDVGQLDRRPLHEAAETGRLDIVELLLAHGAKPNFPDKYGQSPLAAACMRGHGEVARRLKAAGADPNLTRPKKSPGLFGVLSAANWPAAELLLELGADPNVVFVDYGQRKTAMHELIDRAFPPRPGYVRAAEVLLAHGADPNGKGPEDESPLQHAAREGHVDLIRVLLDGGADVEAQDDGGATPLFCAVLGGRLEAVRLLLERGANAKVKIDRGSPSDFAAHVGHKYVAKLLAEKLGREGEPAFPNGVRPTEFGMACKFGDATDVKVLVADDPALLATRHRHGVMDSLSGLHLTAYYHQPAVAKVLLKAKADPDVRNQFERTPLHAAADTNATAVARLLVDAGADLNALDHTSSTPLMEAVERHRPAMVKLLLDAGADASVKGGPSYMPPKTALRMALEEKPIGDDRDGKQQRDIEEVIRILRSVGAPEA